jgi:ribosomal protein S12 methylthiotransferase
MPAMKPPLAAKTKTVAVISLGCPKNTVDSEVMLGRLAQAQYALVKDPAEAEVIIVNTCGFIEDAKRESIDAILDAAKLRKTGKLKSLVVGGCLAQRYGDELRKELPEIDLLFGLNDVERVAESIKQTTIDSPPRRQDAKNSKKNKIIFGVETLPAYPSQNEHMAPLLPDSLEEATYVYDASSPRFLSTPSHFAYVKISEGCDLPCTFCIIPKIRGHYRSRSIEDIEKEARLLAGQGVKELCLVAQDSTWYGNDRYGKPQITKLLSQLGSIKELEWVRLHYLYPSRVTDEMLEVMADHPRIAPYFDVPLQHASDKILKAMHRIGNRASLEKLLERIKTKLPKAALRSTFIVGFPGEESSDFAELLEFLDFAQLDYAGFFAYSKEEDTPAGSMAGQVSEKLKKERLALAYQAQGAISEKAHQRWVGEKLWAVIEETTPQGPAQARTKYQAPEVDGAVLVEGLPKAKKGQWVEVEISHVLGQDLVAHPVHKRGSK